MSEKTGIANKALALIGAGRITDFTDDTEAGEAVRTFYDESKATVLSAFPWRFARTRASLAADATAPAWGYGNQYSLPQDFLAVAEIEGLYPNEQWEIEGNKLLIDRDGPLNLAYTRDVGEGSWSDDVVQAFAAYLAAELAGALAESPGKQQLMMGLYSQRLNEAQINEGRKGRADRLKGSSQLAVARAYHGS